MKMAMQMKILFLALLGLSSALVCPDGGMCEDRNTCCKNTEGGYGCCPLPRAECCSDLLHCCYEGTLCDLVHKRCVNKTVSLPWMTRLPSKQALLFPQLSEREKAVICPDLESECPDETTCCQLPDASWGCCPLAKAVCCEDKHHCCPEGTKCDLVHSRCVSASLQSFPMLEKLPARKKNNNNAAPSAGSVPCPDGKTSCADGTTCCSSENKGYYCCPAPDAVCCSDNVHCCPSNTTCDMELEVCRPNNIHLPLMKKIPAISSDSAVVSVDCPDKKSSCPDETTCCQMTNSSYGCCPMPNAVCCSDHMHCCPEGTECDLQRSACVSARGLVSSARGLVSSASEIPAPAAVTEPVASPSKVGAVPCNDSVACADGNTCCKSPQGQWACCPLPKAVCCEDHLHCCPHATVCNLEASTCDDPEGNAVMPWLSKAPVFPLLDDNNKCDASTSCPGKSTCCHTAAGGWACCPLPQAVCCDDHAHCCPHNTVCNLEAETCDDPSGFSPSVPWVEKVSALPAEVQDEKCDQETMCPRGTTCCEKDSGQWACCPLPQAVCCSDHQHCCPKGYRCNVAEQTCDKSGGRSLTWLQKVPALRRGPVSAAARPARNMCDARTSCPRDTTCCFMDTTHKWGCCPLPEAVCCKDGNHCCPGGHTCEPHRSSCSRGVHVVPWLSKVSATTEAGAVTDVKCDDRSSCASGTTCCKLPTGEWGCCPLVKAVCCADHEHCCPQGYTCNMQTGTCEKKLPDALALHRSEASADAGAGLPCDGAGGFRCPKQSTCCRLSATEWACCPSPSATCCADSKHCCPLGYACDLEAGGCSPKTPLSWDALLGDRRREL